MAPQVAKTLQPRAGLHQYFVSVQNQVAAVRSVQRTVIVALQGGRDGGSQLFDQAVDVRLQRICHAGRQFEHAGLLRFVKIADVTPNRRCGPLRCLLFKKMQYKRVLADAGGAQTEKIVAFVLNLPPEPHCGHGATLAECLLQRREMICCFEAKLLGTTPGVLGLGR